MKNDINALRDTLFDVLAGLKNGTIKIDQAKAINETAQTLINSAKVEVEFMRAGGRCSENGFIAPQADAALTPEHKALRSQHGTKQVTEHPGGTVTTHRMR